MAKNKKGEQFSAADAVADIKKAILKTHKIKQTADSYDYNGIELTESVVLAGSPTIKENLTKRSVEYDKERGRDMLDIFLLKTLQLGFQNGYLELKDRYKDLLETNKFVLLALSDELKKLRAENKKLASRNNKKK